MKKPTTAPDAKPFDLTTVCAPTHVPGPDGEPVTVLGAVYVPPLRGGEAGIWHVAYAQDGHRADTGEAYSGSYAVGVFHDHSPDGYLTLGEYDIPTYGEALEELGRRVGAERDRIEKAGH